MEKRVFGKTGVRTSLLGFGCMRFPVTKEGKIDYPTAERMLDRAYKAGVNYFDTAYPYHGGESEEVLGRAMEKYPRDSFCIATKLPCWKVEKLSDVEEILNEQLKKLRTDYVDFYLMHALDKGRFEKMVSLGVVEKLKEFKKAGKIRFLGFSFHDNYEAFEEILNYTDWDFCQIQYNYMDTDVQAGDRGYELTVKKDITLVIMEPVKGGSLASFADDITGMFKAVNPDMSIASWALRWVGTHENVKVILSGMSTEEQVMDNLKTFENFKPLDKKESQVVDDVVRLINSRVQNGCTGCRYCMPCPMGVSIPETFRCWNIYHMYQKYDMVKGEWEKRIREEHSPANCVECGKCEKACPQKINIREDLKKAMNDLDNHEF